ncbi:MAG: gliding motility-associated C-terminal domain-containing protein [Flavobacteriales bacterium]|nr:gliding motility-associated C-terminal domain-containing protein [Flavobacteriales bacterium]
MRALTLLIALIAGLQLWGQEPCDVSLTEQPISCAGLNDGSITVVTGSGGPFTYVWTHDATLTGATATGLGPGLYDVAVSGPDGCFDLLVTVLVEPDILITGNTTYCPSNPPVLTVVPIGGFIPVDYDWSTGDSTATISLPAGTIGNVSVSAVDANGCLVGDLTILTELPSPFVAFATPDSACQNVQIIVNTVATDADSLVWRWGGFGFSNLPDPTVVFPQAGWQPISLQGFDTLGCGGLPVVDSLFIRAQVPAIFSAVQVPCTPMVDIVLGSVADSCAFFIGDSLVTHDCASYFRWDFGRYDFYEFTLFATQANNCNDTTHVIVDVRTEPTLFLANAFTPNEDGINDFWPDRVDIPEAGFELVLYDRWGNNIWSTTNPLDQWDGALSGGQAPLGVYVYTMKMRDPCSPTNSIEKVGHMTLFR